MNYLILIFFKKNKMKENINVFIKSGNNSWGLGPITNPQTPIPNTPITNPKTTTPNPQSPIK